MALRTGQSVRGQGASQRVTDDDGREFVVAAGGIADTAVASGAVASPAAAGVLVQLTGLTALAVYEVEARITLTGTAETTLRNIELRAGTTQLSALPSLSAAGQQLTRLPRVTMPAGQTTIDLRAIATAVVGSIYTVVLVATRVE